MNLSGYNQLEQLSVGQLNELEVALHDILKGYYSIDKIYIVGSFVFGLDKASDIDIVVCVPEDEWTVKYNEIDIKGTDYMFSTIFSGLASRLLGKEIQLMPNNDGAFWTDSLKQIDPPIYDLTLRRWYNKTPGGRWNNWILRQGEVVTAVDRDSDEGKRLAIEHNKTNTEWTQYRLDNGEEVWDIGGNKIVKLDQFFSAPETVDEILGTFEECINDLGIDLTQYTYIEPSAGDGCILERLPKERRIGIDLEPRHDEVISSDFLEWLPGDGKYITLGNPPFGVRGDMIVKFVRHASKFSDVIGLGVPDYFKMDVDGMEMVCNKQLSDNKYRLVDGTETPIPIRMHFQVWVKTNIHAHV